MTKTRPFLSTCSGDPSATEVPPCCEAATTKLTFSTTSVLLLLNVPLSLSRGTVFRRPKNPRRGYRPKIAGILFVCNEPEGKYYTVPNNIAWCNFILCYHCMFFISQSTSFLHVHQPINIPLMFSLSNQYASCMFFSQSTSFFVDLI